MDQQADTNAAIWQSAQNVRAWAGEEAERELRRTGHRRFLAQLLPFAGEAFTFLDLGAGTGAASRAILAAHPRSTAILADFSAEMMRAGEQQMQPFAGRYLYVEFDLAAGVWPAAIPAALDAVVTSMCVHHLTDERKQGLFTEIFGQLAPGGWYFNYDPVRADDPLVDATWERVNDREDPEAARRRRHRTPSQQARWDNHVRYLIPLGQQLGYLRSAGFEGIDVYYKQLENVIYGGRRPAAGA
jgi:tRNA (cmo5U34)-methyltransferase